jgi:5'-nucleotidase
LKPHLGAGYRRIISALQDAVNRRYRLPPWTVVDHERHKHADRLAAASEAYHVSGWRRPALRRDLGITLEPVEFDPLPTPDGMKPWEPWPPVLAAEAFLAKLKALQNTARAMEALEEGTLLDAAE